MARATGRINVLQVIDKFSMDGINPSSCTGLMANWASHLDPERFNCLFCGIKRPEPAGAWLQQRGWTVTYLCKSKYSPSAVRGLTALIDRQDIHVLHLHGYSSANFGRIAARMKGIPSIIHEHAIMKVQPHQYLFDFFLRRRTDAAVAVSEAVRDFLVHGRCVPPEKVRIIHNGIDLSRFERAEPRRVLEKKRELSIAPGEKVVGVVARFREEKGVIHFIDCAPHVLRRHPDVKFVIAGEGPQRGELEGRVRDLGLGDRVRFAGHCDDVPLMHSMFDVVVIPSLSEGFGLSMVEAMAIGRPIVATRVGGIREIARDGRDALLVPPAAPGEIAEKVGTLLSHPEVADRLAKNARETSRQFSIERNVRQLEDLYLDLVNHASTVRQ